MFAVEPLFGKEEHQERSQAHQGLGGGSDGRGGVHAAEGRAGILGQAADGNLCHQQDAGKRMQGFAGFGGGAQIEQQQKKDNGYRKDFVAQYQKI